MKLKQQLRFFFIRPWFLSIILFSFLIISVGWSNQVSEAGQYADSAAKSYRAPLADLSLKKTVDNTKPLPFSQVVFTVKVTNSGPNPATGVEVTDLLPSGLSYESDDGQGAYNQASGIWTIGDIDSDSDTILHITATVTSGGFITNVAEITRSDVPDNDSTPNNNDFFEDDQDTITLSVQQTDLSLVKSVDNPSPEFGDLVNFKVVVFNNGPVDATGVSVMDLLPSGLSYVSDNSLGSYDPSTGLWNAGKVMLNFSRTLKIAAIVKAPGTITNTAEIIAADQVDPDSTPDNSDPIEDDQSSVTLSEQQADISIAKAVNDTSPGVGDKVTFTLTVSNSGPNTAVNIAAIDLLPAELTYISDNSQGSYDPVTGSWFVGSLFSGHTDSLKIIAEINQGGTITNTATVTSDTVDPEPSSNESSVTLNIDEAALADLDLSKEVSSSEIPINTPFVYTMTITNLGPNTAANVTLTDPLPANLVLISATPEQGSCSGSLQCLLGNLKSGQSVTVSVNVSVTQPGKITNTATVSSDSADTDETNNTAIAAVTVFSPVTGNLTRGKINDRLELDRDRFSVILKECTGLREAVTNLENSTVSITIGSFTQEIPGSEFKQTHTKRWKYFIKRKQAVIQKFCTYCEMRYRLFAGSETVILTAKGLELIPVENPVSVTIRIGDWACSSEGAWKIIDKPIGTYFRY